MEAPEGAAGRVGKTHSGLSALLLALTTAACGDLVPPPVAQRPTALEVGDLAVMRGVLDDFRDRRPVASRFLVVDTTGAICERPSEVFGAPPGGCLGPGAIDSVSRLLPSGTRRSAVLDFQARNATRLPIVGSLGEDVTYISASLIDFTPRSDLVRRFPRSAIVRFSAPSYPSARTAVMSYRFDDETGAVQLALQFGGRWTGARRSGGID
jgi:hypothetical protein